MTTPTRPSELTRHVAAALLDLPRDRLRISRTHAGGNTSWRVDHNDRAFFVKAHTRSWYDWDPLQAASLAVRHEASAYRILAAAGLPVPRQVLAFDSHDNPLQWPCLVLSRLSGDPLPVAATGPAGIGALRAAGEYLAAAHAITFDHAGYLVGGAPSGPPNPDRYMHPYWTLERFLTSAFATWANDRAELGDGIIDRLAGLLVSVAPRLQAAFRPPRFITGDCHAGQIFIDTTGAAPRVTGVVDMEVASAGSPLADVFKATVELAGALPASLRWWRPFFDGYRGAPDLDVFRLFAAGQAHINFTCHGDKSWPGSRLQILRHLLDSSSWAELFDLSRIGSR